MDYHSRGAEPTSVCIQGASPWAALAIFIIYSFIIYSLETIVSYEWQVSPCRPPWG